MRMLRITFATWVLACSVCDAGVGGVAVRILAALALKDTTITAAQLVPAGQFSAPGGRQNAEGAQPLQGSSRVLPRGGDAEAHQRFRYQSRSLAAGHAAGTASSRPSATEAGPE